VVCLLGCVCPSAADEGTNPLLKVLELLNGFQEKLLADAESEAKAMRTYVDYCKDMAVENDFEDKSLSIEVRQLKAEIEKQAAEIDTSDTKISGLAEAIATDEERLTKATTIRKAESVDFKAREAELIQVVDSLGRAAEIVEKESQKKTPGVGFVQLQNVLGPVVQSMSAITDAAGLSIIDRNQLLALVQSADESESESDESSDEEDEDEDEDESEDLGAPKESAYDSHSGSILETLENLKDKAETTLAESRKMESDAQHAYNLLKQALDDETAANNKNLDDQKVIKATAQEAKASAEGQLTSTSSDLENSRQKREVANMRCMQGAADHDKSAASRKEELASVVKAIEILKEMTGGAAQQTYGLLQTSSEVSTKSRWAKAPVLIKKLAKRYHSAALAQLASRVGAVVSFSAEGKGDPFEKVKGLIQDMIAKLEAEEASEAKEKAFCDKEMAKTEARKGELDEEIQKLVVKIDLDSTKSTILQVEINDLQKELIALSEEQKEADGMRAQYHATYLTEKADLELGLNGVRQALSVLRDYYAKASEGTALVQEEEGSDDSLSSQMNQPKPPRGHEADSGAGGSIIGLLEVMESDFASGLTKAEEQEALYLDLHERSSHERQKSIAVKEADKKYKTKEYKDLDKNVAERSSDKETASDEQMAVVEYYGKLKERCIAKPDAYEERKERREAEMNGLKEAITYLTGEESLIQKRRHGRNMRGTQLSVDDEDE